MAASTEAEVVDMRPRLSRLLPGGAAPEQPEVAVAIIALVALGAVMGLRKGFKPVLSAEHVHAHALGAINTFLSVVLIGSLWRTASAQLTDMPGWWGALGRGMAYVY